MRQKQSKMLLYASLYVACFFCTLFAVLLDFSKLHWGVLICEKKRFSSGVFSRPFPEIFNARVIKCTGKSGQACDGVRCVFYFSKII